MAKELTPTELAAALVALGMPVPEELSAKVDNEVEDAAVTAIAKVLVSDESESAAEWQSRLFTLASDVHNEFTSETNNVGRGQADQTKLTIETPDGTLFLRLSRTIESK